MKFEFPATITVTFSLPAEKQPHTAPQSDPDMEWVLRELQRRIKDFSESAGGMSPASIIPPDIPGKDLPIPTPRPGPTPSQGPPVGQHPLGTTLGPGINPAPSMPGGSFWDEIKRLIQKHPE